MCAQVTSDSFTTIKQLGFIILFPFILLLPLGLTINFSVVFQDWLKYPRGTPPAVWTEEMNFQRYYRIYPDKRHITDEKENSWTVLALFFLRDDPFRVRINVHLIAPHEPNDT